MYSYSRSWSVRLSFLVLLLTWLTGCGGGGGGGSHHASSTGVSPTFDPSTSRSMTRSEGIFSPIATQTLYGLDPGYDESDGLYHPVYTGTSISISFADSVINGTACIAMTVSCSAFPDMTYHIAVEADSEARIWCLKKEGGAFTFSTETGADPLLIWDPSTPPSPASNNTFGPSATPFCDTPDRRTIVQRPGGIFGETWTHAITGIYGKAPGEPGYNAGYENTNSWVCWNESGQITYVEIGPVLNEVYVATPASGG